MKWTLARWRRGRERERKRLISALRVLGYAMNTMWKFEEHCAGGARLTRGGTAGGVDSRGGRPAGMGAGDTQVIHMPTFKMFRLMCRRLRTRQEGPRTVPVTSEAAFGVMGQMRAVCRTTAWSLAHAVTARLLRPAKTDAIPQKICDVRLAFFILYDVQNSLCFISSECCIVSGSIESELRSGLDGTGAGKVTCKKVTVNGELTVVCSCYHRARVGNSDVPACPITTTINLASTPLSLLSNFYQYAKPSDSPPSSCLTTYQCQ